MHYPAVKDKTGQQYVDIISEMLVTLFFSALYKCPRVREIHEAGLVPAGSRYLHRFLPVPKNIYDAYTQNTIGSNVAFYCFQSFSLKLSESIGPFIQPSDVNTHLILLRIVIDNVTSARYISHCSAIEPEDEVLALPCIPYSIIGKTMFNDSDHMLDFIRDQSHYDYRRVGGTFRFRGYLIITLAEQPYELSMSSDTKIPNG